MSQPLKLGQESGTSDQPVRLWVISHVFAPVWAGPAERFWRYSKGLEARGVEMTIVTAMRPKQPRVESREGTTVFRVGRDGNRVASVDRFLGQAVYKAVTARPRPNVVALLSIGPSTLPLLWLLKLARIRAIHVSTMARLNATPRRSLIKWIVDHLKCAVYNGFETIVCSSQTGAADITILGIHPDKVEVIPNGVSLERFKPARDRSESLTLRRQLGLPEDEPIALFVGLRVERKGILELVDAWRRYRARGGPGHLVLVGGELRDMPEFDEFYRRWDLVVAGIQPADHIELRPSHPRIEDYFRVADLFIFLSDLEGMPNVIPEAMACGCPVLTTRFRGFSPDLGRDGQELMITERDPEVVSEGIERLLNDVDFRGSLVGGARRWVWEHQDLEQVLDRYAALFANGGSG